MDKGRELLEGVAEETDFLVVTDVLGVGDMVVLLADAAALLTLASDILGSSTGVSEEVTELALELNGVIKLSGSLGALEVEPQNAVHDASIVEDLISHGFLEEAVHVVLLKSGTLIRSLLRGLVE